MDTRDACIGESGLGITAEMVTIAQELVSEAHANDGLVPVDIERFWADQALAEKDPFGAHIPQVPLNIMMSWECVFDELGIEEDHWRYNNDDSWRVTLAKVYNDRAEKIVGRRLINDSPAPSVNDIYPDTKALHDIFEAQRQWQSNSWWLEQSVHTESELTALLDRIDKKDIRSQILPPGWDKAKQRLLSRGIKPPLYRSQRGPVTFATSIYGCENLLFLIMLNPDLAARLRDTILRVMLEIAQVLDEEAGYTFSTTPRYFSFYDDNCYLLTPEMYEFFAFPILKGIFETYAPNPGDWRYQHSDSAMAHLLPVLSKLNFSQVNFGPTLTVSEIRHHMPHTIIQGQLAPYTFSRNNEVQMVAEFLRDYAMAKQTRGLFFGTAGSINNGSRLTGMRLLMAAAQRYGRYQ